MSSPIIPHFIISQEHGVRAHHRHHWVWVEIHRHYVRELIFHPSGMFQWFRNHHMSQFLNRFQFALNVFHLSLFVFEEYLFQLWNTVFAFPDFWLGFGYSLLIFYSLPLKKTIMLVLFRYLCQFVGEFEQSRSLRLLIFTLDMREEWRSDFRSLH